MTFELFDVLRCSCGNREFRLEGRVTGSNAPSMAVDRVLCQEFCGFKQCRVSAETVNMDDCANCRAQRVLEGSIICACGRQWRVTRGVPSFAGRRLHAVSRECFVVESDPRTDPRWEGFVSGHAGSTIYHSLGWLNALAVEYGQPARHLACEDIEGRLVAVLPLFYTRGMPFTGGSRDAGRRLSSLPRTPLGGAISVQSEATTALIRAAISVCKEERGLHLQIKTEACDLAGMCADISRTDWRDSFVLALPRSSDELRFGNATTRHRIKWAVNKAVKLGVEVRTGEDEHDLKSWYSLYLERMRFNAVPPRPYRFFSSLWKAFAPYGKIRLLLAEKQAGTARRLLAGSILLMHGNTVTYAFTGARTSELALHPNDLIQWLAIHDACRAGFCRYDFGEVAEEHQQLAQFKSKWGAEPIPLYRYYWPEPKTNFTRKPLLGDSRRLVASSWRRLPLRLTATLGDWIYSRL